MAMLFAQRVDQAFMRVLHQLEWYRLSRLLPMLMLTISALSTYQLWRCVQQQDTRMLQIAFDAGVRDTLYGIEARVRNYEQILSGMQGLFATSAQIDRSGFHSYADMAFTTGKISGVQGFGFIRIVPFAQSNAHLAVMRKQGFPEYTIKPECRDEFCAPTDYLEPLNSSNALAIGFDNFTDPVRRIAMEQARDTDSAVISGIELFQGTDGRLRTGFLMYLPVYTNGMPHGTVVARRANLAGWVYGLFHTEEMMSGGDRTLLARLNVRIHDGDSPVDETLMYDSNPAGSQGASDSGSPFTRVQRLRLANHYWTVAVRAMPEFPGQQGNNRSQLVLLAGAGASLLLTLLTWLLVYGGARASRDAAEVKQSAARYRQMFEENASAAYLLEPDTGRIVDANPAAVALWGYSLDELRGTNISKISITPSGKMVEVMGKIRNGATHSMEMHHRTKSGEIRDVEVFSGPLTYNGKVLRYSIVHDITVRKQAEAALRLSYAVFNTVDQAVLVTDPANNIVTANPAFSVMSGYTVDELVGRNPHMLSAGAHFLEFYHEMWMTLVSTGSWHGEIHNRRKNGEYYVKWLSIKRVQDEGNCITHYMGVYCDMKEREGSNKPVQYPPYHDALTEVPGEELLLDRIQQTLNGAKRHNTKFALLMLGLDQFRSLNEEHGYLVGDLVLQEFARRLRDCTREVDTVARPAGDRFILVLPLVETEQGVRAMAEKIRRNLSRAFVLAGHSLTISFSTGAVCYPEHGSDVRTLLENVDIALHYARQTGHGGFALFHAGLRTT
ncbi:MAG: CHASE domain-containing protein [Pseudomonadota bacterium]